MKLLVALLGAIVTVSVLHAAHPAMEWWQWKGEHSRTYKTPAEEKARRDAWLKNYGYIQTHNSKNQDGGMTVTLNQFADMVSSRTIAIASRCV